VLIPNLVGRLNARKKHRQSAFGAPSVNDRGLCRIEIIVGLRHSTNLSSARRPRTENTLECEKASNQFCGNEFGLGTHESILMRWNEHCVKRITSLQCDVDP
jgi:hypothetical protein